MPRHTSRLSHPTDTVRPAASAGGDSQWQSDVASSGDTDANPTVDSDAATTDGSGAMTAAGGDGRRGGDRRPATAVLVSQRGTQNINGHRDRERDTDTQTHRHAHS